MILHEHLLSHSFCSSGILEWLIKLGSFWLRYLTQSGCGQGLHDLCLIIYFQEVLGRNASFLTMWTLHKLLSVLTSWQLTSAEWAIREKIEQGGSSSALYDLVSKVVHHQDFSGILFFSSGTLSSTPDSRGRELGSSSWKE